MVQRIVVLALVLVAVPRISAAQPSRDWEHMAEDIARRVEREAEQFARQIERNADKFARYLTEMQQRAESRQQQRSNRLATTGAR